MQILSESQGKYLWELSFQENCGNLLNNNKKTNACAHTCVSKNLEIFHICMNTKLNFFSALWYQ